MKLINFQRSPLEDEKTAFAAAPFWVRIGLAAPRSFQGSALLSLAEVDGYCFHLDLVLPGLAASFPWEFQSFWSFLKSPKTAWLLDHLSVH